MNTRARKRLAISLLALLLVAVAHSGQKEQQPKFGVRVNLVSLDVEVLDPVGKPVLGLEKTDFAVSENGKAMEVSNFAWLSDRPVSLAMVLDTSAISAEKLTVCKTFLRVLAHVLGRSDDLCLYTFDTRDAYLEQEFTSSRPLIMDALENIGVPAGGSGGILRELFGRTPPTGLAIDLALKKLQAASNGRKALLLVSNRFRGLGPATVDHVRQSGCTLLTLGFDNKAALLITLGGDKISRNQLMKESGGRQFSAETPDIPEVCRQIAFSLKNYYALGYLTEITDGDTKARHIDVRIPGRDVVVHFRRSFQPER